MGSFHDVSWLAETAVQVSDNMKSVFWFSFCLFVCFSMHGYMPVVPALG